MVGTEFVKYLRKTAPIQQYEKQIMTTNYDKPFILVLYVSTNLLLIVFFGIRFNNKEIWMSEHRGTHR